MNKKLLSLMSAAVLAVGFAGSAKASTNISGDLNQGWQNGTDDFANTVQDGGYFTLTVDANTAEYFSLTDGFIAGDVYSVTAAVPHFVSVGATTTFGGFPTPWNNNEGPYAGYYASAWLDNSYSHTQLLLGAGGVNITYDITVKDIDNVGLPAGFGFRVDSAVPEPATWMLMLAGFALLGFAGYRRSKSVLA